MPDILQDVPIRADASAVFRAVSTPEGLNQWWTESCDGDSQVDTTFALGFGPAYQWTALVSRCVPDRRFELTMQSADDDWTGTRLNFELSESSGVTQLRFSHTGWPAANAHFRTSCHCWALYLRLLRRYLEHGETVPYATRLDA